MSKLTKSETSKLARLIKFIAQDDDMNDAINNELETNDEEMETIYCKLQGMAVEK